MTLQSRSFILRHSTSFLAPARIGLFTLSRFSRELRLAAISHFRTYPEHFGYRNE